MSKEQHLKSVDEKKSTTTSDKIWGEIKDLSLDLFALPNQKVSMHTKRVEISPEMVHLTLSSQAVLASLETALGKKYTVEAGEKYVSVKYASI